MTDTVDDPVAAGESPEGQPAAGAAPASALDPEDARRAGARRPRRLPRRLPPGVVEAHPRGRERGAAHHHRAHRHLHLLRGAVERLLDRGQHRQPVRPGGLHHPARPGRALRPHSERDRPLGGLRRRGRGRHRTRAHGRAAGLALVGGADRRHGRLRRDRRLPGHDHHQAQDPLVRRDAGRAAGLAGRPDLRLRRGQGRRRRRHLHLQRRDRRPRQRQHDAGRGLDRAGRGRRPLRVDHPAAHLPSTVPGARARRRWASRC